MRLIVDAMAKHRSHGPAYLDTLAAAYAEAGNFEAAIRTETEVIEVLESNRVPKQVVNSFAQPTQVFDPNKRYS